MAEKLCTLRTKGGGGGKYTETSLWTNPSPNSNFAQTTVTLSDSMSNYKYLAFAFKGVTSSTTVVRAVVSVEDLGKMGITSNAPDIRLNGTASANGYSRYVIKASDTTITFGAAYATNTQASDNSRAIPVEILGLNELDHGKRFDETTLWTNSSPTSSFAAQVVTLSDDYTNYDYIKVVYAFATTAQTGGNVKSALMSSADISAGEGNGLHLALGGLHIISGSYYYSARIVIKQSDTTKLRISADFGISPSDSREIPLSIIGCNFV